MVKGKRGFVLYADYIDQVELLPDEVAGRLLKNILRFVNDQNPVIDDFVDNLAFQPIKAALKRDLQKYEERCQRNRLNGEKGGRPPEKIGKIEVSEEQNPLKPTETQSVILGSENNPQKPDNDNDNDNDTKNKKPTRIAPDWSALLQRFNEITGKKAIVVNDKVKQNVLKRLKEGYQPADITQAIRNAVKDEYHIGNGFKYLTLEFITRADIMERYTTLKPVEVVKNNKPKTERL